MEHFVQSVKNETAPLVGGEEGRWAVAGVLAATRSFLEERPVRLQEIFEESNS
jgi:predicted dehydrogenase